MEPSPAAVADPVRLGLAWTEVVPGTQPNAGAGFTFANPSQYTARLLAITFRFVTDANVANRTVHVDTDDASGNIVTRDGIGGVLTATSTAFFTFSVQRTGADWDTNNFAYAPLSGVWMEGPRNVQITVANIQAGDQLSQIQMLWERMRSSAPLRPHDYAER
jgi:hypothetical protein